MKRLKISLRKKQDKPTPWGTQLPGFVQQNELERIPYDSGGSDPSEYDGRFQPLSVNRDRSQVSQPRTQSSGRAFQPKFIEPKPRREWFSKVRGKIKFRGLLTLKRILAGGLFIVYLVGGFVVRSSLWMMVFLLGTAFILLDYLWKTRRSSASWT